MFIPKVVVAIQDMCLVKPQQVSKVAIRPLPEWDLRQMAVHIHCPVPSLRMSSPAPKKWSECFCFVLFRLLVFRDGECFVIACFIVACKERIVEIPQIQTIEKVVQVPQLSIQEVVREEIVVSIQEVVTEQIVQVVQQVQVLSAIDAQNTTRQFYDFKLSCLYQIVLKRIAQTFSGTSFLRSIIITCMHFPRQICQIFHMLCSHTDFMFLEWCFWAAAYSMNSLIFLYIYDKNIYQNNRNDCGIISASLRTDR